MPLSKSQSFPELLAEVVSTWTNWEQKTNNVVESHV